MASWSAAKAGATIARSAALIPAASASASQRVTALTTSARMGPRVAFGERVQPVRGEGGDRVLGGAASVEREAVQVRGSGGVHVEGGREAPPSRGSQEAVVPEVVIAVARDHVEQRRASVGRRIGVSQEPIPK